MPVCFLRKYRKGEDPDGRRGREELEEGGGGEGITRPHCKKRKLF